MNLLDILAIIFILVGGLLGYKKGAIKGLISFVSLLAIAIVAYQFKGYLSTFFIKTLPFFNFAGNLQNIYAVNIGLYDASAFFIIFILLYCLLNILLAISGFVDILTEKSILLDIPNKILGVIVGLIESIITVFIIGIIMLEVTQSQRFVMESTAVKGILERTPIVNVVFKDTIASSENIYFAIKDSEKIEDKTNTNVAILTYYVRYGIVKSDVVQECIDNKKMHLDNVIIAS